MPGRGSYGPGGKWIHDRAHGVMKSTTEQYGPERGKSIAYAIATQQAHKMKKTPKHGAGPRGMYGTTSGKAEARRKYDKPAREYKKTAEEKQALLSMGGGAIGGYYGSGKHPSGTLAGLLAGPLVGVPVALGVSAATGQPLDSPAVLAAYGASGTLAGFGAGKLTQHLIKNERKKARELKEKGAELTAVNSIRNTIEKKAFGRDLRQGPMMGMTTNFPTEYSKSFANKQLNLSQQAAEVGPNPTQNQLGPGAPTIKDSTPPSPTTKGDLPMPKISSANPLIEHMKKAMAVDTNEDSDVKGVKAAPEQQSGAPGFSPQAFVAARRQREQAMAQLFNHTSDLRKYGPDRERSGE